jgi:hypothetical protein
MSGSKVVTVTVVVVEVVVVAVEVVMACNVKPATTAWHRNQGIRDHNMKQPSDARR